MNINIPQRDFSIREGLIEMKSFMKGGYFMTALGLPQNTISIAIAGQRGGKSYHLPWVHVPRLNKLFKETSDMLFYTTITFAKQSQDVSPLAYGDTMYEQIKQLGKCINLPYLFKTEMGKTEAWYKMRFMYTDDNPHKVKVHPDDLQELNEAILRIAMRLARIRLVLPPEAGVVQENR